MLETRLRRGSAWKQYANCLRTLNHPADGGRTKLSRNATLRRPRWRLQRRRWKTKRLNNAENRGKIEMPDFTDIARVRYPVVRVKTANGKKVETTAWIAFMVATASADWLRRFEEAK